jgi:hypothetical protein
VEEKRDGKRGVCQYLRWNGSSRPSDRAGVRHVGSLVRDCARLPHICVGGLAAGEVCADTHPVCRPVPWYQIGKNGDGVSPVGGRLFGCLRCGVCCIGAGAGARAARERSASRYLVRLPSWAVRSGSLCGSSVTPGKFGRAIRKAGLSGDLCGSKT